MVDKGKVSWGANNLVVGGGGAPDGMYDFGNCRFMRTNYNGKLDEEVTVFAADLLDAEGEEHPEMWTVGHDDLRPSTDGETEAEEGPYLINIGDARGVNNNSKFGRLVASLGLAGFEDDKFDGSAPAFNGMNAEMVNEEVTYKAFKKKGGKKGEKEGDGQDQKRTVLIVKSINRFPWDAPAKPTAKGKPGAAKPGAASKPATTNKAAGKPAPEVDEEISNEVMEMMLEVLEEKGGSVSKSALAGIAFKKLAKSPNRSAIVKLLGNAEFLGAEDNPWVFDGTTISLPE